MRNHTRGAAGALLSLLAATATACTATVSGSAVLPHYDGPETVVRHDLSTEILSPGTPVTIGTGALSATCTAGWIVRVSGSGRFGMLTAGHCLRATPGSPVTLDYLDSHTHHSGGPDPMNLGTTSVSTYPGSDDVPGSDVGLFLFAYSENNARVPVSPIPDLADPVPTDPSGRSVRDGVKAVAGDRVCWYTNVVDLMHGKMVKSCGSVDTGGRSLLTVTPDPGVSVHPEDSGAPAVVEKAGNPPIPLGVLSYRFRDKAMVSEIDTSTVAGHGISIMTGWPG